MKKLILFFTMIVITAAVAAQQLHFTSLYVQHNSMYNPAAAGFTGNSIAGLSYRSMWSAFPGNPKTFMAYTDVNWKKLNAGIGAYLYRDVTGPTTRTGVQLAYSYHINSKDEKSKLGLGIELRALQFAVDKSKLTEDLGNDPVLAGSSNKMAIDAGAGIYYMYDKLSLGAAVSQLVQSKLELNKAVANTNERAKLYRHFVFSGSYNIATGENITLIPNFMARVIAHSPSEFDFGCKLDYQDKIWVSLTWRAKQFWSTSIGFKLLKKIGFAYSYDYYETPISQFNAGYNANEIGLRFDLSK
jgi:type IX secretion system PorP/SprF family membrane protein